MSDEDKSLEQIDREVEALVKVPERPLEAPRPPGISAPVEQGGLNHLAMNCVVPGLGSLAAGNKGVGAAQLGLAVFGVLLLLTGHWVLGPAVAFGGWLWSVISGFGLLKSKKTSW